MKKPPPRVDTHLYRRLKGGDLAGPDDLPFSVETLRGPLGEVIQRLVSLQQRYGDFNPIVSIFDGYDDEVIAELNGSRPQTDEEYEALLEAMRRQQRELEERRKDAKKMAEQHDRKLYERLKRKFEKKKV